MLAANTLKGNWGTLMLPVNADESIDFLRLAEEIDYLVAAGIDGIYSNGTAGEFHNQLEDEFYIIQQLLSEKCRAAKMRFQIGASHPSPLISLHRLQRTIELQPDAFQVILPDWVVADAGEQVVFLQTMAKAAAGIPLVLYNPPHAKQVLLPADFERIHAAVPQLIGIKVASGNHDWFAKMRVHATGISVFVPGHFLATGVKEKVASGACSNIACLSPPGAQSWWNLIVTDINAALEIQERILLFIDECILPFKDKGFSNPALDKFLAAVGGWCSVGTRLRWPYKWIDESEVDAVRRKAKKYLPEFFL
ncbi:MAG: dihydrodipicolinate synthase family protein [Chitinophagaceae bacterium]